MLISFPNVLTIMATHLMWNTILQPTAQLLLTTTYHTGPKQRQQFSEHIQSMLDAYIIEPSCYSMGQPVVLVQKYDGSTRFCIDYCKLNAVTKKDLYPLPRIQESLDLLGQYFTTSVLCYHDCLMLTSNSRHQSVISLFLKSIISAILCLAMEY